MRAGWAQGKGEGVAWRSLCHMESLALRTCREACATRSTAGDPMSTGPSALWAAAAPAQACPKGNCMPEDLGVMAGHTASGEVM